jgi:hypothetical protein
MEEGKVQYLTHTFNGWHLAAIDTMIGSDIMRLCVATKEDMAGRYMWIFRIRMTSDGNSLIKCTTSDSDSYWFVPQPSLIMELTEDDRLHLLFDLPGWKERIDDALAAELRQCIEKGERGALS